MSGLVLAIASGLQNHTAMKIACFLYLAKKFQNDSINMNKLFIYSPKLDIDIYGNVFSTLYLFLRYKEKTAALSNNCLLMRD